MSLPVVNLMSDSEDGNDDVCNSFIVSSNKMPENFSTKETTSRYTCSCKCSHTTPQVDPLFRIIFRDEHIARKYRLRIEDILKYVLTSKIDDQNSGLSASDLVLEVYDPATVSIVNTNLPRVPNSTNKFEVERPNNSQIEAHQAINYHDSSFNVLEKEKKQEIIKENEKKRKNQCLIPITFPSNNHNLVDNVPLQKKIKIEDTMENKTNVQPELEPKATINDGNSSALSIIYQKILKQEHPQENRDLETCFDNYSVQIGSYGYSQDKSIFISKDGLTFFVPTFKRGMQFVILNIEIDEITKVFTHFSNIKPSIFFFVTKKAAEGIRNLLRMNDPNGPYIDAGSMNAIHQRIVILPSVISDESKEIIRQLFKNIPTIDINENYAESLLGRDIPMTSNAPATPTNHQTPSNANNLVIESECYSEMKIIQNTNDIGVKKNKNLCTIFFCRVLRVGTFEYPKRRVFSIDINGIKFCIPHLINVSSIVTVYVKIEKIVKLRISFSEACPVIFLHISAEAAARIRSSIGMNDPTHLDPDCGDETRNKIIILPQQLSENCKIIQKLFKIGLVEKLNENVANNILIKSFSKTTELINPIALNVNAASEPNDSNNKNIRVSFVSNSVKIGTYKCVQLDTNVVISTNGLSFHVPKVGSHVFKNIVIPFNEMTKVYYCFKKIFSLFVCTTESCAERIRSILEMPMINNGNVYFNPNSAVRAEQRITIIFNHSKLHEIPILKNLLNHTMSEEVTKKVARQMKLNKL
ncbi:uncharacterized protein LOC131671739 isoform X2 [Phymastichus coffea]|uniref:uncharacterized protein LOC131671739 isoform X2 n=1 Tax=Phymastichus coffea TaxID=108790 RepID=UPI00273C91F2|nr:uncharacterized protein LOC131671739 isoform X2 [Phymastichus coffea]